MKRITHCRRDEHQLKAIGRRRGKNLTAGQPRHTRRASLAQHARRQSEAWTADQAGRAR
jgi:hypothetical protein